MALEGSELDRRRGAWDALSFLFLDNEMRDWLPGAALTLVDLEYSREEIEAIFLHEVTPVLHRNLKQVAGVWSGFDLDWLADEIQKRELAAAPRSLGRFRRILYRMRAWPATSEFDALLQLLEVVRAWPLEQRRPRVRALSVLAGSYFDRPTSWSRERHQSLLSQIEIEADELRMLTGELYRIFAPLRVRGIDPADSVGRAQVEALFGDPR